MSNAIYKKDLQDVALAVAQSSKNYTDNSIEKLKWELGTYDLSVTTDSTVAYTKTIPTNAIKGRLNYIGGASKVSENKAPTPTWYGGYHTNSGGYFGDYNRGITDRTDNFVKPSTTYTLSFNLLLGNTTINDRSNFVTEYASDGTFVKRTNIPLTTSSENGLNVGTFTTQSTTAYIEFSIYASSLTGTYTAFFDGCITNVMLNEGSTALPYQPYFENIRSAKTTSVRFEGANILNITDVAETTVNGLTYKVINDEIYLNGTTNANTNIWLTIQEITCNGTYYFKDFQSGTLGNFARGLYKNNVAQQNLSVNAINMNNVNANQLLYYIPSGQTFANAKLTPMLILGSTAPTSFVPYITPITKAIPQEVLNDVRYGLGFSDTQFNKLNLITKHLTGEWNIVDLGTLNWTRRNDITTVNCFSTSEFTDYKHSLDVQVSCSKYNFVGTVTTYQAMKNQPNKSLALYFVTNNTNSALYINDNDYETANDFKAAMRGVYLLYQTATQFDVDFSQYIDDDFKNIDTTDMTTITFENEFGYDVPSEIDYLIEEVKA